MAHNTRPLKRAQDGVAPQYYNPTTDEYEVLLGQDGAARAILYGPNGQPITNESPLEVRVRQLETLLGALDAAKETNPDAASATLLALIRGLMSAAAKETTLEAIKSTDGIKKIADAVTVSGLENLASELATIKANQLSGDQKVQLSGTMTERYGADVNSRPPADTVPAGATFTIVDESGYFQTWISDGTKWVEV